MSQDSAEFIREFLRRNNVTITEFASLTDLSRWTIYKYLKGGNIQPKVAKRIKATIDYHYSISIPISQLLK